MRKLTQLCQLSEFSLWHLHYFLDVRTIFATACVNKRLARIYREWMRTWSKHDCADLTLCNRLHIMGDAEVQNAHRRIVKHGFIQSLKYMCRRVEPRIDNIPFGHALMMRACTYGQCEAVKWLLGNQTSVAQIDGVTRFYCLMASCSDRSNLACVKLVVESLGIDRNNTMIDEVIPYIKCKGAEKYLRKTFKISV